jgi:hypothetical protein
MKNSPFRFMISFFIFLILLNSSLFATDDNKRDLKDLEDRLNRKIQQSLDNPLSR